MQRSRNGPFEFGKVEERKTEIEVKQKDGLASQCCLQGVSIGASNGKRQNIQDTGSQISDSGGNNEEERTIHSGASVAQNSSIGSDAQEGFGQDWEAGVFSDSADIPWGVPVSGTVAGDLRVTGTLMWYYYVCKRQVWLMAHQINPDEDDPNIAYGRFLQRVSYGREKKETAVGSSRFDIVQQRDGTIVVSEVKKTSRHEKSATMQLLFYLKELHKRGIEAKGELRFPEEKRRKPVVLTDEALREISKAEAHIIELIQYDLPPAPAKIRLCRNCGYAEFCWS
ncbi:MAG: CRISPR-associated protein Cas4 [Bacillota bacterium]